MLATAALVAYAVLLLVAFRFAGVGLVATVVLGVITIVVVSGTLHLLYSGALFASHGVEAWDIDPESIGSAKGWTWLPQYFAALGAWFGLAFYAIHWVAARLAFAWLKSRRGAA
jgi:hypothetical protein